MIFIDTPEMSAIETPTESWVVTEFADAQLNDKRRTQRLVEIATVLSEQPTASFPEACGTQAMLKATYRFFDNPGVDPTAIFDSHHEATSDRVATVDRVLAVQDTTELDFSHHKNTKDIGPLSGKNQQGLLAHTTLAITPERVALGIIDQQVWARDPDQVGIKATRKKRPISQKESNKWLKSLDAVIELSSAHPDTHFVSIGDREADVYDLFAQTRPQNVDWLVRAAWNRCVAHPEKYLWTTLENKPIATTLTMEIPRRGAQPARQATLAVRFGSVRLCPPRHRGSEHLPTITVWAVQAIEVSPPDGVEAVEWLLLTSCETASVADALERLDWYAARWGIEILHKILKSGCRIESRQLETGERLRRCLPVFSVISWRILYATMLARVLPDAPCTAILEADEWQGLYCRIHQTVTLPDKIPSLRAAVHWIARLGGFLDRTGDGEPGATVMWKGFSHLTDITAMYCILRPPIPPG